MEEFVKAAGKCDFDIDIFYNRVIIDAKSILGIMSMDLTQELTVQCYGEDKEFDKSNSKICNCIKVSENDLICEKRKIFRGEAKWFLRKIFLLFVLHINN